MKNSAVKIILRKYPTDIRKCRINQLQKIYKTLIDDNLKIFVLVISEYFNNKIAKSNFI